MRACLARQLLRLAYRFDRDLSEETALKWLEAREVRIAYEDLVRRIGLIPTNLARAILGLKPVR